MQVLAGRIGIDHQRQGAGVGRYHDVIAQPALEPQGLNAEGAVLIIEVRVDGGVTRLRNAPRNAQPVALFDLHRHGGAASLVQQAALEVGHHQHRHQVFEHRARPGQQRRYARVFTQQPSQGEPGALGDLSLSDGHVIGQPHLGRQQVVVTGVEPALLGVVTDDKQVTLVVVKQREIHLRQRSRQ